jgi:hypothetical protein
MSEKKAYTPPEFARLFGRERTWTYRLLYAGKIKGIKDYGRLMIPASEAERIARDTEEVKEKAQAKPQAAPKSPPKGSAALTDEIKKREAKVPRTKGMGRHAKRINRSPEN